MLAKFDKVARESDMLLPIKKSFKAIHFELKTNSGEIPTIFFTIRVEHSSGRVRSYQSISEFTMSFYTLRQNFTYCLNTQFTFQTFVIHC